MAGLGPSTTISRFRTAVGLNRLRNMKRRCRSDRPLDDNISILTWSVLAPFAPSRNTLRTPGFRNAVT